MQWQHATTTPKSDIALLPLSSENANSMAMMEHAMTIAKEATENFNPHYIPVITMDQPLLSVWQNVLAVLIYYISEHLL